MKLSMDYDMIKEEGDTMAVDWDAICWVIVLKGGSDSWTTIDATTVKYHEGDLQVPHIDPCDATLGLPWRRHTRPSSSAAVEARAVQLNICRRAMHFGFVLFTRGSRGVEVVSTYTRVEDSLRDCNSGWIRLGNDMNPLSMEHSQKDEGESGNDNMVAIESAVLEISLSSVGIVTTKLITDGETIVQATKSARNSKLLRWGTIIGSVLFIGGFLIEAYV
eukprot:scaffold4775_cov82-Skeletonema_marinoi.AAC.3